MKVSNYIPITNVEKDSYDRVQKSLEEFRRQTVTIRTSDYRGKGRPRKTDYVRIPRETVRDFLAWEILANGFKT
jgi:hypothetical protein